MTPITKAVIPAAGFGTRLLPATKAQPKEMLTIVDKPVIQYVVEEAANSGITEILIIIAKGKEVLQSHFQPDVTLEQLLESKSKFAELDAIRKLRNLANISFAYQHEQLGLGHALLSAESFAANQPFAVLLGDTMIETASPLTGKLFEIFNEKNSSVVALETVPYSITYRYGVFEGKKIGERVYQAERLIEKPVAGTSMSDLVFAGRYVLTPTVFDALKKTAPGVNHEIQLTDALKLMMDDAPVFGYQFEGKRFDVGNKLDFIKTNVMYGMKQPELADKLRAWLKELIE